MYTYVITIYSYLVLLKYYLDIQKNYAYLNQKLGYNTQSPSHTSSYILGLSSILYLVNLNMLILFICLQMSVGSVATNVLSQKYGTDYTVGTAARILCKIIIVTYHMANHTIY